jgi:hypothetical protein
MAFFKKRSPMEKMQQQLTDLRQRAAALSTKRAASDAALADATAAREKHMLEGDLADEQTAEKLQTKVDRCISTLVGIDAALTALQRQIVEVEAKNAAERAAIERNTAADKLSRDLDRIEKALPAYLAAARQLADAVEPVAHFHYEANELGAFTRNGAAQIEVAAAFAVQELRGMVEQIKTGAASMPPKKPEPLPVAAIEQPVPTQTLFCRRTIKWRDPSSGRQRAALALEDVDLPLHLADKALRIGACAPVSDEMRKTHKNALGGVHPNPDARGVVDLDAVEEFSGARYAGPDPVLRQADFRVIDRSSEERVILIEAGRAG